VAAPVAAAAPSAGGYVALSHDAGAAAEAGLSCGTWERGDGKRPGRLLANVEVDVVCDEEVIDEGVSSRRFSCVLRRGDEEAPFNITTAQYASDKEFLQALYAAAGPAMQFHCSPTAFRNATAALNPDPPRRRVTTSFGWEGGEGKAFLVPGGRITAAGYEEAGAGPQVDLSGCDVAASLGLCRLGPSEVDRLKRHLVEDWLPSHSRRVTYPLLGTVVAALLYPFARGVGRYYLWLRGMTGSGKSFQAVLAQHWFGDFGGLQALGDEGRRIQSWVATPNHIQLTGYFFRHCVYLVDDYKPSTLSPGALQQVLKLLQSYHDGTGRGRLRSDSTFLGTRPIRGLLLATGEDVPEHSASTTARGIITDVLGDDIDYERGGRCLAECQKYSGVTADLIRWLIDRGYPGRFEGRVRELQAYFYNGVSDRQNALRVASNIALLAAGLQAAAEYFADVWPGAGARVKEFIEKDLAALRDGMLASAKEEQESEVFLRTLSELAAWGAVVIDGCQVATRQEGPRPRLVGSLARTVPEPVVHLSMALALAEVQENLRKQNRPLLKATEQTLIGQLRKDGWVIETGKNHRINGVQTRCVVLKAAALSFDVAAGGRGPSFPDVGGPGGPG
jgi:hypothetical protein